MATFEIMDYSADYLLMSGLYIVAGIAHWVFPKIYLPIVPRWIPGKRVVIWLSGLLEVVLGGALLYPPLRDFALYGIMGMLLLFLPVHIQMLLEADRFKKIPVWALWVRIPLQGLLIFWAYAYL